MSPKTFITALLSFLVGGSLAYMGIQEFSARRTADNSDVIAPVDGVTPEYIVYYFSVGKECTTCEQIEAYTREALTTYFADDLASGKIQWRTADMDKPEHEHFATDYDLYTKSIVLVAVENGERGRWENLPKVWDYVYDHDAFTTYIRDSLQAFMEPAL